MNTTTFLKNDLVIIVHSRSVYYNVNGVDCLWLLVNSRPTRNTVFFLTTYRIIDQIGGHLASFAY